MKPNVAIICSQVSLCTQMTYVPDVRALMVSCILGIISVNVGRHVFLDMRHIKNRGGSPLLFSSLITELCKRDRIEDYSGDTWLHPKNTIYPLMICGEGALAMSKKRNIDVGKSTTKYIVSCRTYTTEPFK